MIRLKQFGTVLLPANLPRVNHQLRYVSGAVKTVGGAYDSHRTDDAPRTLPWDLPYSCIVAGANRAALQTVVEALEALGGVRERLWGVGENNVWRWAWARLLDVDYQYSPKNVRHLDLNLRFEMWTRDGWYGPAYGGAWNLDDGHYFESGLWFDDTGATLMTGYSQAIALANAGNRTQRDVGITVFGTTGSKVVSSVRVQSDLNDWTWTGTLAATKVLTIDCLTKRVLNDGVGAISGFALGAGHVSGHWLDIPRGGETVTVTMTWTGTGTNPSIQFTYADGLK